MTIVPFLYRTHLQCSLKSSNKLSHCFFDINELSLLKYSNRLHKLEVCLKLKTKLIMQKNKSF